LNSNERISIHSILRINRPVNRYRGDDPEVAVFWQRTFTGGSEFPVRRDREDANHLCGSSDHYLPLFEMNSDSVKSLLHIRRFRMSED
jgi:hypothetical protein